MMRAFNNPFRMTRLTAWDRLGYEWVQGVRSSHVFLASVSRWLSRIGDGYIYALIGIVVALSDQESGRLFLTVGLIAYLLELPVYWGLKNAIRRPRPFHASKVPSVILPSDQFSLPSGHSAAAFVFATTVAQFYPEYGILAYFLAASIGASRVVLGVHYPTDIVAGAALGILSAEIAWRVVVLGVM
jgi:undecaprenyl-diphosphatase